MKLGWGLLGVVHCSPLKVRPVVVCAPLAVDVRVLGCGTIAVRLAFAAELPVGMLGEGAKLHAATSATIIGKIKSALFVTKARISRSSNCHYF